MSTEVGSGSQLPGVPGDYHGRRTRRLESSTCWVDVLADGGPRVVGFGLRGGANVLAETPEASWDHGHGLYELLGGHRFWFAPESADCSVPDATGLTLSPIPDAAGPAVRLVGAVEAPTGLRKTFEVRLDPESAVVSIRHILSNEGSRTLEIAPWPITQLRPGGVAIVPLPKPPSELQLNPNQLVALWPYAVWTDPRLHLGERTATIAANPAPRFKIGFRSTTGSAGYLRDGVLFVLRFDPALGSARPDLGCNLEIYTDERTIELESLGPLVRLSPGDMTTHDERWELRRVEPGIDAAGAATLL
jgi:hypothetical protein